MKLLCIALVVQLVRNAGGKDQKTTVQFCPDIPFPSLPSAYVASIMINKEHKAITGYKIPGKSSSVFETADMNLMKAKIVNLEEMEIIKDNVSVSQLVEETYLWNPQLSGIEQFLTIFNVDEEGNRGEFCLTDKLRPGSFIQWMFGYNPDGSSPTFPSIAGMLHWANASYTSGCPTVKRGIEVNTFNGMWRIDAWDADLNVKYYWSNPLLWEGTAGPGVAVPVSAELEGQATINGVTDLLTMNIDFSDFFEANMEDGFYFPDPELWCEGRKMPDKLPEIPIVFSYTGEMVLTTFSEVGPVDRVVTRNEWFNYVMKITRLDYKPLDLDNTEDPFDGNTGMVTRINDFVTGLSYLIDQDFGNCSIDYIVNDGSGDVVIENGAVAVRNPFFLMMNGAPFAYNGKTTDRSISMDSYIHTGPMFPDSDDTTNETTVIFLTSLGYEMEDGDSPEMLVPVKIVNYPTDSYNSPESKYTLNIFHFSKEFPDFEIYDISNCIEDNNMIHIGLRMSWNAAMNIEGTVKLFRDQVREKVAVFGRVTAIRVVNIEFHLDREEYLLVFTVLGYPPDVGLELNEIPDAFRNLTDIKSRLQEAVDNGEFKVRVANINEGEGPVDSVAKPGPLIEFGDRHKNNTLLQSYTKLYKYTGLKINNVIKQGHSAGAMAALGIVMLIVTIGGSLGLLVYVFKW